MHTIWHPRDILMHSRLLLTLLEQGGGHMRLGFFTLAGNGQEVLFFILCAAEQCRLEDQIKFRTHKSNRLMLALRAQEDRTLVLLPSG